MKGSILCSSSVFGDPNVQGRSKVCMCKETIGFSLSDVGCAVGPGGPSRVIIPEGMISISNFAYYKCVGMTSVSLPSTLKTIGACLGCYYNIQGGSRFSFSF